MFITEVIGPYIGVFVEWGFLMAFLYNVATHINNSDKRVVQLAFIMAFSYMLSGIYQLPDNYFLTMISYDLLTLFIIIAWALFLKVNSVPALIYVLVGLTFNTLLAMVTYYDIYIQNNRKSWWLWSVYSYGINISDLTMILALIFNKKILHNKE